MRALAVAGSVLLASCAIDVDQRLAKVRYDGAVSKTSDKSASIRVITGVVEMDSNTERATRVYPTLKPAFDVSDQGMFAESLKDELNRLQLLRVTEISWQDTRGAEVAIDLIFQRTRAFPGGQYILDVVMELKSGVRKFARRYQVFSGENETTWTKMNTDAAQGKALAAKKLIARLIPDIEAFVAGVDPEK